MKVLYVSPYPPAQDGIGTYTFYLAEAAREIGHDVRIVVPRPTQHTSSDVIGAIGLRGRESAELLEAVAKWNPDVVHVQFAIAAFGTRTPVLLRWLNILRRDLAVPVVCTFHEVTTDTALLRAAARKIYRRLIRHCEYVIVHTRTAYRVLTDRLGVPETKALVIPHPRRQPSAETSTPAEVRRRFNLGGTKILLAFGFIQADKGLDDLVSALGILRRANAALLDDVCVVIAGAVRPRHGLFRIFEVRDRIYLAHVLRDARQKSLRPYLVLTGYVPDGEISAWFRAAEAVVLPYHRTEQSGVANLATAFAVPVLSSTVGGLREQFAGSRWTFPSHDPESLARILATFLATPPSERKPIPAPYAWDLAGVVKATVELYHKSARGPARLYDSKKSARSAKKPWSGIEPSRLACRAASASCPMSGILIIEREPLGGQAA
jgi:glycosyltransferase involved in cell wall biosynthesis